jgi:hypothetical protein
LPAKITPSARQKTAVLPTKKDGRIRQNYDERRGWIEFPKKGTKNPRRYAYKRRWLPDGRGGWKKSKPVRYNLYPPLTEADYVKIKEQLEQAKRIRNR